MEDQAKAEYAAAQQRRTEEERKLNALLNAKEGFLEEKKQIMEGRLDFPKLNSLTTAIEDTDDKIVHQRQILKRAELALSVAEGKLVNAMQERKTHEILRDNAFERFRQEMNAEEQKEIDERTGYTYGNAKAGGD